MYNNELYHYGVKGMKWGHRKKYYNSDGTLNKLGQARQNYKTAKKEYSKSFDKAYNRAVAAYSPFKKHRQANDARWEDAANKAEASRKARAEYKQARKEYKDSHPMSPRTKTAIKVGAAAVGTVLAVYGAKKASDYLKSEAGKRVYEAGQKVVDELQAKQKSLDPSVVRTVSGSGARFRDQEYQISRISKQIGITRAETNENVKKVSGSTKEAVKYLYSQRKRRR